MFEKFYFKDTFFPLNEIQLDKSERLNFSDI